MQLRKFIIFLIFASYILACGRNPQADTGGMEVKQITHSELADEIEPPPPGLTSNYKNIHDWLVSICDGEKPQISITSYNFGLFESQDNNTITMVGLNKYEEGDTTHVRIEFKPANMYFPLPHNEFKKLSRDQLLDKLVVQLKAFTKTEKFKTSFLAEADALILESNGQTVWSK